MAAVWIICFKFNVHVSMIEDSNALACGVWVRVHLHVVVQVDQLHQRACEL